MKSALGVVALFVFCGVVTAASTELPAAAKQAFQAKYPGVTALKVTTENENGATNYEIKFKDAAGLERELELTEAGEVVSEAVEVKAADLPKAVVDAINTAYPGAKIEEAKLETEKNVSTYEVEIETKDGDMKLEISADGAKILQAEKADGEKKEGDKEEQGAKHEKGHKGEKDAKHGKGHKGEKDGNDKEKNK
jgi:uncharacterized membrane protein YkoI